MQAAQDFFAVLLAVLFFAVLFFAGEVFFAVAFVAVFFAGADFFAAAFVVLFLAALVLVGADFFAVDFVAVFFADADFFAVDFVAVFFAEADFFAAAFVVLFFAALVLAGADFFAAVDFEAVFFAVELPPDAALAAVDRVSFGSFFAPETTAFRSAPALNFGTAVFLALMRSPVRGLRTQRASRTFFSNDPKPVIATFSPLATSRVIVSSTDSSAWAACFRLPS